MPIHRPRAVLLLGALGCALAIGTSRGFGDEPPRVGFEPKALQLLNEVIAAYRALPAYGDQGEFVLTMVVAGQPRTQKIPLRLTLVRPNKLSLEAGLARVVSDGTTLTTWITPLKKYATAPAPKTVTFDTVFTGGAVGSAVFGGPGSPMMLVVLNLLLGDDPARSLLDLGDKLSVVEDEPLDGRPCRVLKLASDGGGTAFHLRIDPATKLLRAIDLTSDPKALADAFPEGQGVKIESFRWTSGPVSSRAADDATFAIATPQGFTKMDAPAAGALPANEEAGQKFKVQALVGKPAPDFTLTVFDGVGKTRTVSRADLAGKVVLIDFWATWCGPCLQELPQIQKLVERYAREKKGVMVVAVSQDSDPRDPAEVRKLIEETLRKQKIELNMDPVGRVALDPSHSVGGAFEVEGYPTVVVLDTKGVVRSAHVGYSEEVGKTLGQEIDALLEGKPIGKVGEESTKKPSPSTPGAQGP